MRSWLLLLMPLPFVHQSFNLITCLLNSILSASLLREWLRFFVEWNSFSKLFFNWFHWPAFAERELSLHSFVFSIPVHPDCCLWSLLEYTFLNLSVSSISGKNGQGLQSSQSPDRRCESGGGKRRKILRPDNKIINLFWRTILLTIVSYLTHTTLMRRKFWCLDPVSRSSERDLWRVWCKGVTCIVYPTTTSSHPGARRESMSR